MMRELSPPPPRPPVYCRGHVFLVFVHYRLSFVFGVRFGFLGRMGSGWLIFGYVALLGKFGTNGGLLVAVLFWP